ncbi:MAG: hypothetical protein ACTSRW_07955 [Candidatus Helarchaeota archaeon]
MSDKKDPTNDDVEELVYQISERLVDDQVADLSEDIKGEIEELLILSFHPDTDIHALDQTLRERVERIREVITDFKEDIKKSIKNEILDDLRKNKSKKGPARQRKRVILGPVEKPMRKKPKKKKKPSQE